MVTSHSSYCQLHITNSELRFFGTILKIIYSHHWWRRRQMQFPQTRIASKVEFPDLGTFFLRSYSLPAAAASTLPWYLNIVVLCEFLAVFSTKNLWQPSYFFRQKTWIKCANVTLFSLKWISKSLECRCMKLQKLIWNLKEMMNELKSA